LTASPIVPPDQLKVGPLMLSVPPPPMEPAVIPPRLLIRNAWPVGIVTVAPVKANVPAPLVVPLVPVPSLNNVRLPLENCTWLAAFVMVVGPPYVPPPLKTRFPVVPAVVCTLPLLALLKIQLTVLLLRPTVLSADFWKTAPDWLMK